MNRPYPNKMMTEQDVLTFMKKEFDAYDDETWENGEIHTWDDWKAMMNREFLTMSNNALPYFNWDKYFEDTYLNSSSRYFLIKVVDGVLVVDEPHEKVDKFGDKYWVVRIDED